MNTTAKNPKLVKSMFASVAHKYDRANSVLSMGVHHLWRAKLVKLANFKVGQKVLDCATGTGDLAIAFKKAVGAQGEVIGTDFCEEMLSYAPQKAQAQELEIQLAEKQIKEALGFHCRVAFNEAGESQVTINLKNKKDLEIFIDMVTPNSGLF